jgi:ribosomal protein S18 acetylase RimI-like enzyme
MRVEPAGLEDVEGWLALAREVEPLFGPMAESADFQAALRQAIGRHEAFCIRSRPEGTPLVLEGAVVVSKAANEIAWLAVSADHRGQGHGRALLTAALTHLDPTRPVTVQTFAATVPEGQAARDLYRGFGFTDQEDGGLNPAGVPTVIMQLEAEALLKAATNHG